MKLQRAVREHRKTCIMSVMFWKRQDKNSPLISVDSSWQCNNSPSILISASLTFCFKEVIRNVKIPKMQRSHNTDKDFPTYILQPFLPYVLNFMQRCRIEQLCFDLELSSFIGHWNATTRWKTRKFKRSTWSDIIFPIANFLNISL